jgi:RNA polymerase sigma factor (TIGR02999 family)
MSDQPNSVSPSTASASLQPTVPADLTASSTGGNPPETMHSAAGRPEAASGANPRPIDDAMPSAAELTRWLANRPQGEPSGWMPLFQGLYNELRNQVQNLVLRAGPSPLLTPSTLSHDAWMKLPAEQRVVWGGRSPFLAVASAMLRQILVQHELTRRSVRPEGERAPVALPGLEQVAGTVDRDLVAVHDALQSCADAEPRAAKVVELRFFGGLENHEIAEALGLPLASVKRDWAVARAWLQGELATA